MDLVAEKNKTFLDPTMVQDSYLWSTSRRSTRISTSMPFACLESTTLLRMECRSAS